MLNEETGFGDGFSDGVNGKIHRKEFQTQEYFDRYHRGFDAGKERMNQRFAEYNKHAEKEKAFGENTSS